MSALRMKREVDEAVRFANAHRLRTDILCLLNEKSCTTQELSRLTRTAQSTVHHHLNALLEDGCIEIAETKKVRNFTQNTYRAVKMPYFTDAEMAALPFDVRQEIYGLIIQAAHAESLAALAAGTISNDRRASMAWKWFNVDQQGREDVAEEMARSWRRLQEIEAESVARRLKSEEPAVTLVVSSFGYRRARANDQPAPHIQGKLVDKQT